MPKQKNKKKNTKPTFNQIVAEMKGQNTEGVSPTMEPVVSETVSDILTPIIEKGINPNNELFRWVFLPGIIRDRDDEFGFGKYKKKFKDFLEDIEKVIYEKYANKTWQEVDATHHCGPYKKGSLSQKQKDKLSCVFSNYFTDTNTIREIQEQLYHITLKGSHRLYGYRYNSIFYIVLNDVNHNFDKL